MEGTAPTPANWYPDPHGRHQLRYWDGARWTQNVSNAGVAAIDNPQASPSTVEKLQGQVAKAQQQVAQAAPAAAGAADAAGGGGHLLTEPILVVNQKRKVIELTNEYSVFDAQGNLVGMVRQTGQSAAKKVLRFVADVDQFMTHHLDVTDAHGNLMLTLTRPRKFMKSTLQVKDASGGEIGRIAQQNVFGKISFSLEAGGATLGSINAENWRAWNFSIRDHTDTEVARITKTFEGVVTTMFTTADNYVLHIHRPLEDPLRSLVIAASLCVDTALKQDSRGLN